MKAELYYIAILPDTEIAKEVEQFKENARDRFNSARALRSPAHITLEPPFKSKYDSISELKITLTNFASEQSSFLLDLSDFGAFTPFVIFVDVIPNSALMQLQASLYQRLRMALPNFKSDRPNRSFLPHMTVAFKDLRKEMFPKAWAYFSSVTYQRSFRVNSICLLRHDGEKWQLAEEFRFGGDS